MLRDFLSQTIHLSGLSTSMVPTPSDYSLSEFSEGEAFIIPLLCRTLEAIGTTNERLDLLTATVENLEITASSQSAQLPLQPHQPLPPLSAAPPSPPARPSHFHPPPPRLPAP